MKRKLISATDAARSFSELLNHVKYRGNCYDIKRGKQIVASLVPWREQLPADAFLLLIENLPNLNQDDIDDFANDIDEIRKIIPPEENEWT